MSGAEVLAVVGGISAFVQLLYTARDVIAGIRSGLSKEQFSVRAIQAELRYMLFETLQKFNISFDQTEAQILNHVYNDASRQLKELQELLASNSGL
jgi:hypothetical protein